MPESCRLATERGEAHFVSLVSISGSLGLIGYLSASG
jgi:hypothetical protein